MTTREVELSGGAPWGFRMHGGADQNQPLRISRVNPGRKASLSGIREGDVISSINGQSTKGMSNADAHAMLRSAGPLLRLGLNEDREVSPRRRSIGKASELKRPSQIIAEVNSGRATPQPPVYATIRPSQSPHNRTFSSPMRSLNSVQTTLSSTPLVKSIAPTEEPLKFHPTNPFYTTLPSNYSSASKLPVPNGKASLTGIDRNKSITKCKESSSIEDYNTEIQPPVFSTPYDPSPRNENNLQNSIISETNLSTNGRNYPYSGNSKHKNADVESMRNNVTQTRKNPFDTKRNNDLFKKYLNEDNKMNGTSTFDSEKIFNSKSDNDFHSREEVIKQSTVTEHKLSEIEEVKTVKKIVLNGSCDNGYGNNERSQSGLDSTKSPGYRHSLNIHKESPANEHHIMSVSPNNYGLLTSTHSQTTYFDTLDRKDPSKQRSSSKNDRRLLEEDCNSYTSAGEIQPSEVVITKPPARSPNTPSSKRKCYS